MCGRYTLSTSPQDLTEHFGLDGVPEQLAPRYNIAPSQAVAIVREVAGLGRRLEMARWGLIPSWAKDPHIGSRLINARAETLAHKPAFRHALRYQRCLIPADGFYEWKRMNGHKRPYWVGREGRRLFGFAGLWEHWEAPHGEHVESCTIVTTDASALMREIHDRMPAIVRPEHYQRWLDPTQHASEPVLALLGPYSGSDLIAYPVSRAVNNPRTEAAQLLEPVAEG